jgi:hypothetical protein
LKSPILIFLSFLLLAEVADISGAPPPPEEIQKSVSTFFKLLKENKIDEAYQGFLTNTRIKGREEEVANLKKQTRDAITTYGPVLGFEIIEQRRVGMNLIQVVCLSLSENVPLRWRFTYYRPTDKWRLQNIFVDDRIEELFDLRAVRVDQMDKTESK